jgi:hypothetical protein
MFRKVCVHCLVALMMATVFIACGEKVPTDPHMLVTLREATRGMVVSKGFKYRFDKPDIVALHGNLGIIREGNLLEFIGARSLEEKLKGLEGQDFQLAVVKQFSPFVHFEVVKVYTPTDTLFMPQTGTVIYPRIMPASEFNADAYESKDINTIPYNRTGVLNNMKDNKYTIQGKITLEDEEGRSVFFLDGENAKLRVADTGDGLELMMKVLAENNYPFDGGIVFSEVEGYSSRTKTHIAGTVDVQFVKYNDRVIIGG